MDLGLSDKLLYLVGFSLYSSLFWELRDKRNFNQVFKTSDVLNSDENIVNIALIGFCSLAVTNLVH